MISLDSRIFYGQFSEFIDKGGLAPENKICLEQRVSLLSFI